MTTKIKASIVGGAGYTAGELIGILLHHPQVELLSVSSTSNSGNLISDVHQDLLGETDLRFSEKINSQSDLVFLCLGHGHSADFLKENPLSDEVKIIDLSNEFRLRDKTSFKERKFIYGLPELNREQIKKANNIANPGCFATAIQLALLPLAKAKKINNDIHVNAVTGSTGAGQSLMHSTHFSWRNNNVSFYKEFDHQHEAEVYQSIHSLQEYKGEIFFLPMRGNFSRGILAGVYVKSDLAEEEAKTLYQDYYKGHPFTHISDQAVNLKQVINTNKCALHISKPKDQVLLITSVIDNLTKGASGQAVQNMNLLFGLDESLGLNLKAVKF